MAVYDYSGIKSIRYDTQSGMGGSPVSLGSILASSPLGDDDVKQVPTGKGTNLYGGKAKQRTWHVPDNSKFSALDTLQKADTEIYVEETDLEDNTSEYGPGSVMVKKITSAEPGTTGYIEMTLTYFSIS